MAEVFKATESARTLWATPDRRWTGKKLGVKFAGGGDRAETYLRFDLKGVAWPIAGAVLRLYQWGTGPRTPIRIAVFTTEDGGQPVADMSWTEAKAAWTSKGVLGVADSRIDKDGNGWLEIPLDAGAMNTLRPGTFVLRSLTEGRFVAFLPQNGDNEPQLVITAAEGGSAESVK
jgi:hypothetical protein